MYFIFSLDSYGPLMINIYKKNDDTSRIPKTLNSSSIVTSQIIIICVREFDKLKGEGQQCGRAF